VTSVSVASPAQPRALTVREAQRIVQRHAAQVGGEGRVHLIAARTAGLSTAEGHVSSIGPRYFLQTLCPCTQHGQVPPDPACEGCKGGGVLA
jgi:hypothetical protein